MKRFPIKLLALLTAMTMLFAGCSENSSSGSSDKESSSSSSSQSDSSSSADSSSQTDSSDADSSAQGGEQTTADTIPWDYDVPDPDGNTESTTQPTESSNNSDDSSDSESQGDSQTTTTAAAATTTTANDGNTNTTTTAAKTTTKASTTTTTTKKSSAPTPTPTPTPTPSGTPVQKHGALHISGNHIVDSHGKAFMLQGMSTHGIMWSDDSNVVPFSDILSESSLKVLRDDWKCNAVRIAMYTEEWGGYTTGSSYASQAKAKVNTGVANATKLGMYVIIDWHILRDGNPQTHQNEAIAFFREMANKYKGYNNVIFELCNEPNGGVTWASNIKPYCQAVISSIRGTGAKNLVICGTGTWSQDIDQVLSNRLSDTNCAYTLHFYANTHTDWLRQRLQKCYNSGLPVLVTEFGTCDASGNGGFNESQTRQWYSLLANLKVGWFNWSAASKNETASAFKPGTKLGSISAGESQLTQSGKLIRTLFRANAANAA